MLAMSAWGQTDEAGGEPPAFVFPEGHDAVSSQFKAFLYETLEDIQDGHHAESIPRLEAIIEEDPTIVTAWESLGWCYWETGQREKAVTLWKELVVIDPTLPLPYVLLAIDATTQKNFPLAIRHYKTSLELNPLQYEVRVNLARVLRWSARFQEAIALLEQSLAIDPDRNDVKRELARACTANRDYDDARPLWKDLLRTAPKSIEYITSLALCELHTGHHAAATTRINTLLGERPDEPQSLDLLARIAEGSERPEDAVEPLQKLMDLQTTARTREYARVRLIRLLIRLHALNPERYGLEPAIALTRQRISELPDSADARLLLGELYTMDQQLELAEAPFVHVITHLNADNRRAHRGLFEVYRAQRRFALARKALTRLAEFNPRDPYLHYYEAQLQAARGDLYKARQSLDRLERAGSRGAVACLLYHGITTSPFVADAIHIDRMRDHLRAMKDAGFTFVRAGDLPRILGPMSNTTDEGALNSRPTIHVLIDFDGGRRDSMEHGTALANEFDMVFSMHLPVGRVLKKQPFSCSWNQLREYGKTGRWEFGSHLVDAAMRAPIDAEGARARPLPNRIWLDNESRNETRTEYANRIEDEFARSRRILWNELGGAISFVSYPFGSLGQEAGSNVDQPSQIILQRAARHYDVGFIQSQFGYAVAGDNPLLYQRYRSDRHMLGADLVDQIYQQHPVFLARRLRAEFAALEGKQYLALKNIRLLREDGFPEHLLDELSTYVYHRLAGRLGTPTTAGDLLRNQRFWDVDLHKPFLGLQGEFFRDNQTRQNWRLSAGGGVHLTPNLRTEVTAGQGWLKQEATNTNIFGVANGDLQVDTKDVGLKTTYTFNSGFSIVGDVKLRDYSGDASHQETAYALQAQFRPLLAVDIMLRYEHDMTPSVLAVSEDVSYEAPSGYALLRLSDVWDVTLTGAHYAFSDDNTRNHFRMGTSWTLWERTGLHLGVNYAYASSDENSNAYWTPYELNRLYAEIGFRGSYLRTLYNLRFRCGIGGEEVRPETQEAYEDDLAQAIREGWDDLPTEPEEEW